MMLWALWRNRNAKLWLDAAKSSMEIVSQTMSWFDDYSQANKKAEAVSIRNRLAKWSVPLPGCLKFNVDGAFLQSSSFGGLGGVARDQDGSFVAGFAKQVNYVLSAYHVELLGTKEALLLLLSLPRQ